LKKCKELLVISVNKVADLKRIIGKNGRPRRRRGIKGSLTQKNRVVSWVENCIPWYKTTYQGTKLSTWVLNLLKDTDRTPSG
jgi:hypothetical protein